MRLIRQTETIPDIGIYHCVIQDDTNTEQTVYVGLYNSSGQGWSTCNSKF